MVPPNVMSRRLHYAILIADLFWILISLAIAYLLREGINAPALVGQPSYMQYSIAAAVAVAVWGSLYGKIRLDGFSDGWDPPRLLSRVVISVLLLMSIMLSTAFLARQFYSRLVLSYFGSLLLLGFVGIRCFARAFITSRSRAGEQARVVIIGSGRIAREIAEKIERHPELMKKVLGFLYPSSDLPVASSTGNLCANPVPSANTAGVVQLLINQGVNEVVIAHPRASTSEIQRLIHLVQDASLKVSLVPEGYELYLSKASFLDVEGLPILSLEELPPHTWALAFKRFADVSLAAALLLLATPALLVSALALLMRGKKPFRTELRCGLQGRTFHMWRVNLHRDQTSLSVLENWLARLSLTELPQLLNVLLGDMSLVGPRPESPDRVKHYSDWQRRRLRVKPGLTGLAQVHGLRDQHSSEDKARFDLQYLLHWSLLLDLSLLVQTIWTVGTRLWRPASSSVLTPQPNPVRTFTEVLDVDSSHAGAD